MKKIERPKIEGRRATLREKVGALIAGKPLNLPGEFNYHREDFADVQQMARLEDPLALARRMARIFKSDHDKLDKMSNRDELYNEMDYDAIVGGARQRYEDALHAADMTIDVDPRFADFCEKMTKAGKPLMTDTVARSVDSETRGFVLSEFTVKEMDRGDYQGFDTINEIRRLEGDAYRLEEDEYSRPSGLELWVADPSQFPTAEKTGKQRFLGTGGFLPQQQVVIRPGDPDWDRFLFWSFPERGNRVAGLARYGVVFPWYFFAIHLRQWMMTLAERTGTPILIAEFAGDGDALGEKYRITNEDMFDILEKVQTNFRGLVPAGYKVSALATGAEGLAALLQMLFTTCWQMIDLGINGEIVSGGSQAQGGTLGANQTIVNTTFGGHVAAGHRRIAGRLSSMLEFLIKTNWGATVDVEINFEPLDPVAKAAKVDNMLKGLEAGLIDKHEPWTRDLVGAPVMDEELLSETSNAKDDAERFGILSGAGAPATSGGAAAGGGGAGGGGTDEVLEIIDRVQDGDIGDELAATLLAPKLGISIDEARVAVAAEKVHRSPEPEPVAAPAPAPAPEPQPVQPIAPSLAASDVEPHDDQGLKIASWRMRGSMDALRPYIRKDYDTTRLPPVSSSLLSVVGAVVQDSGERKRRATRLREVIGDGLSAALDGVESDADALSKFSELAEYFCEPSTLREFLR